MSPTVRFFGADLIACWAAVYAAPRIQAKGEFGGVGGRESAGEGCREGGGM